MDRTMHNYELYHHGILGQKWGIRRYQNKDGTLTKAGQKRYQDAKGNLTAKGEKAFRNKDGSINEYGQKFNQAYSTERVTTIPKGSTLYRTSTDRNESTSGEKYVTYFQSDRNFYRGQGADWIAAVNKKPYGKLHELQYEVTKDIKIPPRKEVEEIYRNTILNNAKKLEEAGRAQVDMRLATTTFYSDVNKNKSYIESISDLYDKRQTKEGKEYFDKYYGEAANERLTRLANTYKNASDKSKAMDAYLKEYQHIMRANDAKEYINAVNNNTSRIKNSNIQTSLLLYSAGYGSPRGTKLKNEMIAELKKRGYNAMSDEAGIGGHGNYRRETRQALIIFDANETLSKKSDTKLDERTYRNSVNDYNRWVKGTKGYIR